MQPTNLVQDTIHVERTIQAPLTSAWAAYSDTSVRSTWGVPLGEGLVYERDDLRSGGSAMHRCGDPAELQFHVATDYLVVVPSTLVVHTETVRLGEQLLSTSSHLLGVYRSR